MKINHEEINRDLEAIKLLEEIIDAYQTTEFRPQRSIELYQRYKQLQAKENAQIAGPFLVITGGRRQVSKRKQNQLWKRSQFTVIAGAKSA